MANKVKFGLTNVHYAKATINADGTATYGTIHRLPGAVSLSLDPSGELYRFFADNGAYYSTDSNAGYTGSLSIALITDEFRKEIMGDIEDQNGALVEVSDAKISPFALMFQFEGDEKSTRHVIYNATASRPSISGQTAEETVEPQPEELSISVGFVKSAALDRTVVKSRVLQGDTGYSTFFDSVYQPIGQAFAVFPNEISIAAGEVGILETSGAAGTITATSDNTDVTCTVSGSKVVVTVDDEATEGASLSVSDGATTRTVTVNLAS